MPITSVYRGCQIDDEIGSSLRLVKGELASYQKLLLDSLEESKPVINRLLSGENIPASAIIGDTVDNQLRWTAQKAGREGNEINILYLYLGPNVDAGGNLVERWPSAEVIGNSIICTLHSDPTGHTTLSSGWHAVFWLSNPEVVNLISISLVGAGTEVPVPTPTTFLEGGSSATLKNAEEAANEVAKIFGEPSYTSLLKTMGVPVVETEEEAKSYLNESDKYVIINGKLLVVEGTNLTGINKLWEVLDEDYEKLVALLSNMQNGQNEPCLVITQNVSRTRTELVCNEPQAVTTVVEQFRNYNKNIYDVAKQYASGDVLSLNLYIFWSVDSALSAKNSKLLEGWGIPETYRGDILLGQTPEEDGSASTEERVPVPEVYLVEDPDLLNSIGFSKDEVIELIGELVDGIKPPQRVSIEDRGRAVLSLTRFNKRIRANGMLSGIDTSSAASQALDLGKTLDDTGLSKELSTRGKACARQESVAQIGQVSNPNVSTPDLINAPDTDLPNASKQVEAAFGAITSVVDTANSIFNLSWNATVGVFSPVFNKLQNLKSLADNLFNNSLTNCLLGTGSDATGVPEPPVFGSQQSPGINIPDVTGGLPIPSSLLKDALKELAVDLDISLTSSFEQIMNLIRTPLCIVQSMMSFLSGFQLPTVGGLLDALNFCKEGADVEDKCPPEETQEIINASEEMTSVMQSVERISELPTEAVTEEVSREVENFTGFVTTETTEVTNEITRGVKQVMEDIQSSLDTKLAQVDQLLQAVKSLFGDMDEMALSAEENQPQTAGCGSTTIGAFTDAISEFVG